MGLGHAGPHPDYPGLVSERYISENNQRLFYRRWEEFMNAASWADIPLAPLTARFDGTATMRGSPWSPPPSSPAPKSSPIKGEGLTMRPRPLDGGGPGWG